MTEHLLGSDSGYLSRLARQHHNDEATPLEQQLAAVREAMLEALEAAARGEIPEHGPRGGKIWPARYYVRRVAWHVLDHTWELEDRSTDER